MMSKCVSIKHLVSSLLAVTAFSMSVPYLYAHHNTQSEFGAFGSQTMYAEGTIVGINWGNPHITIDMRSTGGDIPAGENWRLQSHPISIMEAYGFAETDFAVGDSVRLHGWKHLRNHPLIWPRAIQINDGPMRSNLRFTDMIDIANGVFESLNIEPPANLNGSPPQRAGPEVVQKLREMGLLDEEGLVIWPPP